MGASGHDSKPPAVAPVWALDDRGRLAWRSVAMLTVVFFSVTLLRVLRHEPWRDEVGIWLLGRASSSPMELLSNLLYGGHPSLWPLLVWPFTKISDDLLVMQVLHVAIAAGAVSVLLRASPFDVPVRVVLAGSYFVFYEYSVITRAYGPGMLCLFLVLANWPSGGAPAGQRSPSSWLIPLVLLPHTSVFGAMLTIAFVVLLLVRLRPGGSPRLTPAEAAASRHGRGLIAVAVSLALAVLDMWPPADSGYAVGWTTRWDAERFVETVATITRSYVPVAPSSENFWGANVLDPHPWVSLGLAVALLTSVIWRLRNSREALAFFVMTHGAMLAFFYLKFIGFLRHHGHLFLALLAALWLAQLVERGQGSRAAGAQPPRWELHLRRLVVTVVLGAQVFAAGYATYRDWREPFSGAEELVQWLRETDQTRKPIAADRDHPVSPVAARLDRELYYPRSDRTGSFVIWDLTHLNELSEELLYSRLETWIAEQEESGLLIVNVPLVSPPQWLGLVHHIERSIVADEVFWIYDVER